MSEPIPPSRMVYDFPLRPNYRAQFVLPSDMTTLEAHRLIAFINSLAQPETT